MVRALLTFGVIAMCVQCACAETYSYAFRHAAMGDTAPGNGVSLRGQGSLWTDGYNGEPAWPSDWPTATSVNLGIYNTKGVGGWNADTGFYIYDDRAALAPGQTRVIDNIYLWAGTGVSAQDLHLYREIGGGGIGLPPEVDYHLFLVSVPQSVQYDGPREWGKQFLMSASITLPYYSSSDGTTGYRFRAEFTAVPEPSSLLALFGGIGGLGTLVLRRRR